MNIKILFPFKTFIKIHAGVSRFFQFSFECLVLVVTSYTEKRQFVQEKIFIDLIQ